MIVETVVHILLQDPGIFAITGDRIFPDRLPDATDFPAVVVQKAAGAGEYTNTGDAGIENARIQIDCYSAKGSADCVALKQLVRRRLSGFKGGRESGSPCAIDASFCINDSAGPAQQTERAGPRLWRRMLEFNIWNREL